MGIFWRGVANLMGKMKELYCRISDEISMQEFSKEYYDLTLPERKIVDELTEKKAVDYWASEADKTYEEVNDRRIQND